MKSVTVLFLFLHVLKTMAAQPVTAIQNCPHGNYVRDGYIKQGTVATCECVMKNISKPPAQAEWHNSKGEKVGRDTGNGVSILTIEPRPENRDESYKCVGDSLNRQGPPVIYKPKIAYGPTGVHVEINGGSKQFVMCHNNTVHVQVSIATDSVNPKPKIVLGGLDDHLIVSMQDSVQGKFNRYDYNVMPKKDSKSLRVNVFATNPIFSDIVVYNYDFTVPVQHSSSPVLTLGDTNGSPIVNGSSQSVTLDDVITVSCQMPVADPNVNEVTIKCLGGVYSKSDIGTHTSLDFIVREEMDKQKCTCITHDGPSGCYNLETEFVLTVNYPPTSLPIMTVTGAVQGPDNTRVVNQGQDITIECRVAGGRPEVRSVYIECGSRRKEDNGIETTLELRVKKEMNGQNCLCSAHHVTGSYNKKAEFTLDVYYPPASLPIMTATGAVQGPGNTRVVNQGQDITIECRVAGGRPEVRSVYIECGSHRKEDNGIETTLELRVKKEMNGQNCLCSAHHVTGSYNKKAEFTLDVHYPPTSLPIMTVTGAVQGPGNTRVVNQGQDITIKCRVAGGRPEVRSVYIECGSHRKEDNGTETTLELRVKKEMNGQNCLCSAHHVTGSYNKKAEFTLDVYWNTTVTKFTANDMSPSVEVSKDDNVTFSCEVDGDTTHDLLLTGQRSNKLMLLEDVGHGIGTKKSEITKTMACNDMDVYTCAADDDDTDNTNKTVSVFVMCPPQLTLHSKNQAKVVEQTKIGSNVRLEVDVYSYPEPNEFVLIQLQHDWKKSGGNALGTVMDSNLYNVIYTPISLNEGTVLLEMVVQQKNNSAHYALSIQNGVGKGIHYMFEVIKIKVSASKGRGSRNSLLDNNLTVVIAVACSIFLVHVFAVSLVIVVCKWRKDRKKKMTLDPAGLRSNNPDYIGMVVVHQPRKRQVDSCEYEIPINKTCDPNVYGNLDGTGREHLSGAYVGTSPVVVVGTCCKDGGFDEDNDDELGEGGYMDIDSAKASAKEYEKKMNASGKYI